MVCSIVKKSVVGAVLGAGALYMAFGTHAPSYVKTAFHKVRQNAKDAVDPQFEIDRARDEIANLRPMIETNIETLARAEVDAEHLERETATIQTNLDREKKVILGLRDQLKTGEVRLTGHTADAADEIKGDLAHRYDHFRYVEQLLTEKQATLKAKRKTIKAAHDQLESLRTQKSTLLAKLAGIEARLRMIEATSVKNEFHFDDSALSRAKQTVAELEERLDVLSRRAEMEGRYAEGEGTSSRVDPSRDVVKEVDDAFGGETSRPAAKSGEKTL